jgi:hypothetical protein
MLAPRDISAIPAVRFGRLNEEKACRLYYRHLKDRGIDVEISECGLQVYTEPHWSFIGATPDRIIKHCRTNTKYILEIKNLFDNDPNILTIRQLIEKRKGRFCCDYDRLSGVYTLKKDHDYYFQMLTEMACYGCAFGHLVICFREEIVLVVVHFDLIQFERMKCRLWEFYSEEFLPELLKDNAVEIC